MNTADNLLHRTKSKMEEVVEYFRVEVGKMRSDRVSPELVDDITISVYGQGQPLKHVANITSIGPRTLEISVWDQSLIPEVEKSLQSASLGASPVVQGKSILLSLPTMSQETREQIIKLLHQKLEEVKISLRSMREDAIKQLKDDKEDSRITEDEFFKGRDKFDELIHDTTKVIEKVSELKEKTILGNS